MNLENFLPQKAIKALCDIANADDWSFSNLVKLSGLDPSKDFRFLDLSGFDLRGADLRGYDFTGADLKGCLKDASTTIDHTTILRDAAIEWIEVEKPTIVQKMSDIENARTSGQRRRTLTELVSEYQSPEHTRRYLRNLIDRTRSVEAFFDYVDFFKPETGEDIRSVANGLRRFSDYSVKKRGKTRKYLNPSTTSYRILLDRISESNNVIVAGAYNNYLTKLSRQGRDSRNPIRSEADEDFKALMEAIEEAGGQRSFL